MEAISPNFRNLNANSESNSSSLHIGHDTSDKINLNEDVREARSLFPLRLMKMLSEDDHSDIVSWLGHGNAFRINKHSRFVSEVMPKYFKESKYTSFTRKLNRWGFLRVSRGIETGAYYHPLFKRGNVELCLKMTYCSVNKTVPRNDKEQSKSPPSERSSDALNLAQEIQENMLYINKLTQTFLQKNKHKPLSESPMNTLNSSLTLSVSDTSTEQNSHTSNIVMSQSALQASIDALRKRINGNSIKGLQTNTEMLLSLSQQLQGTMQHFLSPNFSTNSTKKQKGASAA